jgi:hypothetical protein
MSSLLPSQKQNTPIRSRPARDTTPRRLIVTVNVVFFTIRDWNLWILLREGPWGSPMRLVLGNETVDEAVEKTLDSLLLWPDNAPLLQLKAGWQEQQVYVWGSSDEGASISLVHSILLRADHDHLRPNLRKHPIPSLHVEWVPVATIEEGKRPLDPEVKPVIDMALHSLRSYIQRDPEIVLRYLADMETMGTAESTGEWWWRDTDTPPSRETRPLGILKEPKSGDGVLTLAEATLLYRAFFPADEQIDLSNLRRRFLNMHKLAPTNEERPVRGREMDWRRVSRAYRYAEAET